MKNFKWISLAFCGLLSFSTLSCGGDDPVLPDNPGNVEQPVKPSQVPVGLSYSLEKPDADQPLTITFKAGKFSKLYNYKGDVYIHIGVISEGQWQYVPAAWDQNLSKCKMTAQGDNVWSITLSPSIRGWFRSGKTPVQKLGIVIRSADGSKKGIESDSFVNVQDAKYKAFEPAAVKMGTMPASWVEGINILSPTEVGLVLYDKDNNGKRKDFAHVVGDFNQWTLSNDEKSQMYRDEAAGCWWITLRGLEPTREYAFQYYIGMKGGEVIRMGDAYAEKILDPDNDKYIPTSTYSENKNYPKEGRGIVSVFKTQKDEYAWKVKDFQMVSPERMVIYEILLRDFTNSRDLAGAMAKIPYLKKMGVNAIELMPVQEFDGNDSWGYNPCFFFAMDKAYGTPTMYKKFIDACHEAGIAVILDVVYNHATGNHPFAKLYWNGNSNKTATNNPYFNVDAPHPYSVFHDFNHESPLVRKYVKRNLQYLLKEYHLDGFRFDLTKGFTQRQCDEGSASRYDAERIKILTDYYRAIAQVKPDAFVVLEHFCDKNEESVLAREGMHLWRNQNYAYGQAAKGDYSNSSFTGIYEKDPAWVGFMESHDEERLAFMQINEGKGDLKTRLSARMDQLALNAAFCFTVPGPKMIWQFGEMGYDVSIEEGGRTGRKPLHWEYLDNVDRKRLHQTYTQLLTLRNEHPRLFDSSAVLSWKVNTSNWGNGRTLYLESVIGEKLVVLGNFTSGNVDVPFPATTGTWKEYPTQQSVTVGDRVRVNAHQYKIYTNF